MPAKINQMRDALILVSSTKREMQAAPCCGLTPAVVVAVLFCCYLHIQERKIIIIVLQQQGNSSSSSSSSSASNRGSRGGGSSMVVVVYIYIYILKWVQKSHEFHSINVSNNHLLCEPCVCLFVVCMETKKREKERGWRFGLVCLAKWWPAGCRQVFWWPAFKFFWRPPDQH